MGVSTTPHAPLPFLAFWAPLSCQRYHTSRSTIQLEREGGSYIVARYRHAAYTYAACRSIRYCADPYRRSVKLASTATPSALSSPRPLHKARCKTNNAYGEEKQQDVNTTHKMLNKRLRIRDWPVPPLFSYLCGKDTMWLVAQGKESGRDAWPSKSSRDRKLKGHAMTFYWSAPV